jgi:hypothetical protein
VPGGGEKSAGDEVAAPLEEFWLLVLLLESDAELSSALVWASASSSGCPLPRPYTKSDRSSRDCNCGAKHATYWAVPEAAAVSSDKESPLTELLEVVVIEVAAAGATVATAVAVSDEASMRAVEVEDVSVGKEDLGRKAKGSLAK